MLPVLNAGNETKKQYTLAFRGLDWGQDRPDGALSHSENLSSARFPCLSQRMPRRKAGEYLLPDGCIVKDGLLVVSNGQVFHNGREVGQVSPGRKQLAAIGEYVVIFPDRAYFNTVWNYFGYLQESVTVTGVVFTHDSITVEGTALPFRAGDAVTIDGCFLSSNNRTAIVRGADEGVLTFYPNTFTPGTYETEITISRDVPELDFVCESNYRLWGTCGNTIYASKYGDPFNFQVFDGLSGDSYRIDVASEGPFTGCIACCGHICFFKEHTLHKIYGSRPANFQLVTTQVSGLQAGSERSLCVLHETLYYKGVDGVYAYTGGVPEPVSACFGQRRFTDAAAAGDDERYYISMCGEDGWQLLTYDLRRGIWLREDAMRCVAMARLDGHVYLLEACGLLWQTEAREESGADIPWSATFCPFSETVFGRKGYSRLLLRLELEAGAWLQVQLRRDNEEKWTTVSTVHGSGERTVSIPVLPARCDRLELRLSGKGRCLVRTMARELTVGSDAG